jgi:hypothetical protein
MDEAKIRISVQISNEELKRRWTAVRKAMAERKIDYLIMRNSDQHLGGYIRWFTDIPGSTDTRPRSSSPGRTR